MDYRNYSIGDQPAKEQYAGQSPEGPSNPFAPRPSSENARPMTATETAENARLRKSAKMGLEAYERHMQLATFTASLTIAGLGLPDANAKFIADASHHFQQAFAALRKACDLA